MRRLEPVSEGAETSRSLSPNNRLSATHESLSGDGGSALSLLQSNIQLSVTSLSPWLQSLGNRAPQSYNSCRRAAGGETETQRQMKTRAVQLILEHQTPEALLAVMEAFLFNLNKQFVV